MNGFAFASTCRHRPFATRRNVLKRFERIELMKAAGKWKEGDRGRGLPKTKKPV